MSKSKVKTGDVIKVNAEREDLPEELFTVCTVAGNRCSVVEDPYRTFALKDVAVVHSSEPLPEDDIVGLMEEEARYEYLKDRVFKSCVRYYKGEIPGAELKSIIRRIFSEKENQGLI